MQRSTTALNAYTSLLSETQPIAFPPAPPTVLPFAQALFRLAHDRGTLPTQGAWQLHSSTCQKLSSMTQNQTPPGGWSNLAAILAGTTLFEASSEGFKPLQPIDTLDLWTENELKQALVESLSMFLIPPTSAAGLFLMLGVHPAWGLRVAHETHKLLKTRANTMHQKDVNIFDNEQLFPEQHHHVISHSIFAFVSIILEILRSLDTSQSYHLTHFAQLILEALRFTKTQIQRHNMRTPGRHLDPFIDKKTGHLDQPLRRALDFTALDLMDSYLVPAGIVHRFNNQTFCVWPEHIPETTTIFGLGELRQNHWLTDMIAESSSRLAS